MRQMKRMFSMLLAGILCVSMLAGLTGCGSAKDNTPVVMTVDGEDVQSSELAAYIVYNMMYYENYFGMDINYMSDDAVFQGIKDGCKDQVVQYRALRKLAKNEGVSLSKESKQTLEDNKNKNRESLGSKTSSFARWIKYTVKGETDPFVEYLNSYGYTEELYDKNCETMQLREDLINSYSDEITERFNNTYLHAKSILISDSDESGNLLTGDAFTAKQKEAQEILDKVNNGEDFDQLWKDNNSDTAQPEDGYYFTEGDMVDEYYQGVKDLDVDGYNKQLIYHEGYGWFIVHRLDLNEDALTDTSACLSNAGNDSGTATIKDTIGSAIISDKLDEVTEDMEVTTTEEYDNITALNVNTYLPFAADAFVSGSGSAAGSAANTDTADTGSAAQASGSAA